MNNNKTPYQERMEPPTQFYRERFPQEKLAKKLEEELDAEETKFFAFQGKVINKKNVIAWGIRQRARQDAHELRGDYPPKQIEAKHEGIVYLAPEPIKTPKKAGT